MKRISLTGKILFVASALMLVAAVAFAAPIAGVNVPTSITPFTTFDEYPTHDSNYGKGGLHWVAEYTDLVLIPESRRYPGMLAYAQDVDAHYELDNDGVAWSLFVTGGGDATNSTPADYDVISALATGAIQDSGDSDTMSIYFGDGNMELDAEENISLSSQSGFVEILSALAVTGTITENGIDMLSVTDGDLRYLMNSTAGTDLFKLELGGGVDDPTITVSDVGVMTVENLLNDLVLTSEGDVVVTAVQDIRLNGDNVYKNGVAILDQTQVAAAYAPITGSANYVKVDGTTTGDIALDGAFEATGDMSVYGEASFGAGLDAATLTKGGVTVLNQTESDLAYAPIGGSVNYIKVDSTTTGDIALDGSAELTGDLSVYGEASFTGLYATTLFKNGASVANITEGNALWASAAQGDRADDAIVDSSANGDSMVIAFGDGDFYLDVEGNINLRSESGDVQVLSDLIVVGSIITEDGELLTVSQAASTYVPDVAGAGQFMRVGTAGAYMTIEADGTMDFYSDLMNITMGAEGEVIMETDTRVEGDLYVDIGDVIVENDVMVSGSVASGIEVEAPIFSMGNGAFITTTNINGSIVFVFDDGE